MYAISKCAFLLGFHLPCFFKIIKKVGVERPQKSYRDKFEGSNPEKCDIFVQNQFCHSNCHTILVATTF